MKKNMLIIAAVILAFAATSCNNSKTGTDNADTTTVPAETTIPAGTPVDGRDTTSTAPVDPAMDTSANQTPKM